MKQAYNNAGICEKLHQSQENDRGDMPQETFGRRLRVLRAERDLSQIALRDRMEKLYGVPIGETYISELERTEKMPSLEVAAAMAKALDVSLDYLGLVINEPLSFRREPPAPDSYYSEQADEVAKLVDDMQPQQRDLLLNVAKSMVAAPSLRQRERAEIREILDSIERKLGRAVRREVEQVLRGKGMLLDSDA